MSIKTVAVAGATGTIGPHIVKQLAAAGFVVTALVRASGQPPSTLDGVSKILPVDYGSIAAMTAAIKGHDAVVSALSSFAPQDVLIEASVAAGVKRVIASEYGLDYSHPRTSELPLFVPKLAYRKRLAQLAREKPSFSWSVISTGLFLEWSIENKLIVDASSTGDAIQLWDGGDSAASATTYEGIGLSVVGVLKNEAATKNRAIRVSSAEFSPNQILAIAAKRRPEIAKRGTVIVNSEDAYHQAVATVLSGTAQNPLIWAQPLVLRGVADNIGGLLSNLDNDLLGVKRLTAEELEKIIIASLP